MHDTTTTGLRLTDADRNRALKRLDRHHRAGRIDKDEFAERGDAVRTARTYDDLVTVFADLEPSARAQAWAATGVAPFGFGGPWRRGPGVFPLLPLLVLGIVLAATDVVPWLPVLVIAGALLLFAPFGHHRHARWGHRGWAC